MKQPKMMKKKTTTKVIVCQQNMTETDVICPDGSPVKPGVNDFVLVSFKGSEDGQEGGCSSSAKAVYYVGWIVRFVSESKVETKFLRRADLKKTEQIKFCYPEEDDFSCHSLKDIVLVLRKPVRAVKKIMSKRLGSFINFDDDRLNKFHPIR